MEIIRIMPCLDMKNGRVVKGIHYDDIRDAIQRESNIKHWPRAWKIRLIHDMNPEWRDLYGDLA